MMTTPILEASELSKSYPMPAGPVTALKAVDLRINVGDYISISGPSGCGKSTLLHLFGCVETPSHGRMLFDGDDVQLMSDAQRSRIRLTRIGFVFQRFFLLPMLTAFENIELPQSEAGRSRTDRRSRTEMLLSYVGLTDRMHHRPSQLSGGEMQRVAIARALANKPQVLLADEPTGELDERTSEQIAELLGKLNRDGHTLVVVTHDSGIADRATRRLKMRDGRLS